MKLYLFGIGGTGARIIKSLTMLSAAGMKFDYNNCTSIIPIIIDPDASNKDLQNTISVLDTYMSIRGRLDYTDTDNNFFRTVFDDVTRHFTLPLQRTSNTKFRNFIDFGTMSPANQAFASMLFSDANLNADMTVGFKGNPNIGSVVLNQFSESQEFIDFANSFNPGDRIFIISSIFGGTGASGFPLLLKLLRSMPNTMPNYGAIKDAVVGAITVLPYFQLQNDPKSPIDSSTFIGKTKAALSYYDKNIIGNNSLERIYYIGNQGNIPQYVNNEGGQDQHNPSNKIEFFSALAVLDFLTMPASDKMARKTEVMEFGIADDNGGNKLKFSSLYQEVLDTLYHPMTEFMLFSKYLTEQFKSSKLQPWRRNLHPDDRFVDALIMFSEMYLDWIWELAEPGGFKPFELNEGLDKSFDIVTGKKSKKWLDWTILWKYGYDLFENILNKTSRNKRYSQEQQFLDVFYQATNQIVTKKL